jgi:hypothetical protein
MRLIRLVLALGLTLVPLAGEAQQAGKVWRIGVLYPGADNSLTGQLRRVSPGARHCRVRRTTQSRV